MLNVVVVKPLTLSDSFGPPAFPLDAVFVRVDAFTILLAVFPCPLVKADSVGEDELSLPLPLVILKGALIHGAIRKLKAACTVHLAVKPLAFVRLGATLPREGTLSLDFVLLEFAFVLRPVRKSNLACALFHALAELSLILHAILLRFDTVAILLPIFPLPVVNRPIGENVLAFAILQV